MLPFVKAAFSTSKYLKKTEIFQTLDTFSRFNVHYSATEDAKVNILLPGHYAHDSYTCKESKKRPQRAL